MAAATHKKAIYAAIVGNFLIAVTKFIAGGITGSVAMIAEGIHSLVDTGNGGLLLLGLKLAKKEPDRSHPFGYGKEVYFWTLVVAMSIFAVGGGISLYEGISHTLHPEPSGDPLVNYIVLSAAILFEGYALSVALKEFNRIRGKRKIFEEIRLSKDPTTFTVLFEDAAAMLGLVVAMIGIYLARALEMPVLEGVASILIGVILIVVAIFLAVETKGLLLGESADVGLLDEVRAIAAKEPAVTAIADPITVHYGPNTVVLNIDVEFDDALTVDEIEHAIDRMQKAIREVHPEVKHIYLSADALAD